MRLLRTAHLVAAAVTSTAYMVLGNGAFGDVLVISAYLTNAIAMTFGAKKNQPDQIKWWYALSGIVVASALTPLVISVARVVTSPDGAEIAGQAWGSAFGIASVVCVFALLGAGKLFRSSESLVEAGALLALFTSLAWSLKESEHAGDTVAMAAIHSVLLVTLCAVLGLMLRVALARKSLSVSFRFLLLAGICGVLSALFSVNSNDAHSNLHVISYTFVMLCMYSLGASALHPSVRHLSDSGTPREVSIKLVIAVSTLMIIAMPLATFISGRVSGSVAVSVVASVLFDVFIALRLGMLVNAHDKANRAVAQSEERLRALVTNSADVIFVIDRQMEITYVSPSVEHLFGIAPASILGSPLWGFVVEDDRLSLTAALEATAAGHATESPLECRSSHDGGRNTRWLDIRIADLTADPAVNGMVIHALDVTTRKRSKLRLAAVAQLSQMAMSTDITSLFQAAVDIASEAVDTNDVAMFCHIPGRNTLVARNVAGNVIKDVEVDLSAPGILASCFVEKNEKLVNGVAGQQLQPDVCPGASSVSIALVNGKRSPFGVLAAFSPHPDAFSAEDADFLASMANVIANAVERLQSEEELRQAGKLEAIGRLASGVAHEMKTPLQFVQSNMQFIHEEIAQVLALARTTNPSDDSDVAFAMDEMPAAVRQSLDGIERMGEILNAMKTFGHMQDELVSADINAALESAATMAKNEWKYVANLKTDFSDIPQVECLISDLNQVFLNLIVNAAHAIEDVVKTSGELGTITLRTILDGDHVIISVSDTGTGIPPEIQHRMFEAFFTTKEVGRGTGQGLILIKSVVERHNGSVTFDTSENGTTFHLRLPCHAAFVPAG